MMVLHIDLGTCACKNRHPTTLLFFCQTCYARSGLSLSPAGTLLYTDSFDLPQRWSSRLITHKAQLLPTPLPQCNVTCLAGHLSVLMCTCHTHTAFPVPHAEPCCDLFAWSAASVGTGVVWEPRCETMSVDEALDAIMALGPSFECWRSSENNPPPGPRFMFTWVPHMGSWRCRRCRKYVQQGHLMSKHHRNTLWLALWQEASNTTGGHSAQWTVE
jgi:hypothetical protein